MTIILDYFNQTKVDGDIGIEVEVEALDKTPLIEVKGWVSKTDGSLRNHGVEYTTLPCNVQDVPRLCTDLFTKLQKNFKIVEDSPRTSIHVHVNVQQYTLKQAVTAIIATMLMDSTLIQLCSPMRKSNQYCLRIQDAESVVDILNKNLTEKGIQLGQLNEDRVKYTANNYYTLMKFGTIENRMKDGELNVDKVVYWVNLHYHLVKGSLNFYSPSALIDELYNTTFEKFVKKLFSGHDLGGLLGYLDADIVKKNAEILFILAYSKNWDRWEKLVEEYLSKNTYKNKKIAQIIREEI